MSTVIAIKLNQEVTCIYCGHGTYGRIGQEWAKELIHAAKEIRNVTRLTNGFFVYRFRGMHERE